MDEKGYVYGALLIIKVDGIEFTVEAKIGTGEMVDFKIARADGEDYENFDEVLDAAIDAFGYVILNDVEVETLH